MTMLFVMTPKILRHTDNRGKAKKALGQQEAAEADFAKARQLDPDVENISN